MLSLVPNEKFMTNQDKIEIFKELHKELEDRKKRQVLFSQDYITIEYDAASDWLHADWIGYQTEATVVEGCTQLLQALVHTGCGKVLNDNTHVLGIWTPAAQWVGAVWMPQMKAAGLKQFAWVYSPSALSQFSTNEAVRQSGHDAVIRTFLNGDEARKWLKEGISGNDTPVDHP